LNFKNFIFICGIFLILILFDGCSKKDEEKPKYNDIKLQSDSLTANKIATQVAELNKTLALKQEQNLTVYDSTQGKMVISGAADQEILNGFALAISQVMIEEGVSIPDCSSLAKTGYLTKEDCDSISNKYFGFYDFDENGNIRKIDDVLLEGLAGEDIQIRSDDIEYFDNSNNPLLGDFVKFKDFVSMSGDIDLLKSYKNIIPNSKVEMQKLLDNQIFKISQYETNKIDSTNEVSVYQNKTKQNESSVPTNNSNTNSNSGSDSKEILKSVLASLKIQHARTKSGLDSNPNDPQLRRLYEQEAQQIASLESQL